MDKDKLIKQLDALSEADKRSALEWLGLTPNSPFPATNISLVIKEAPKDAKLDTAAWLLQCREILKCSALDTRAKISKIGDVTVTANVISILKTAGLVAAGGYKKLPLSLRVSIPATLAAAPFLSGSGVGIAALGGAIGVPALLVFFLGTSGITAILESIIGSTDENKIFIQSVLALIATDAAIIQMRNEVRAAVAKEIVIPDQKILPKHAELIRSRLFAMTPREFECHVVGFFKEAGMTAWVTPASNDAGIDGIAKDGERLVLIQCKRYAAHNLVGRPEIQQFKGVMEENMADLGVFVTSSSYTSHAFESAHKNECVILIDMNKLIEWHMDSAAIHKTLALPPAPASRP